MRNERLTSREAAEYLGISYSLFGKQRSTSTDHPPFFKITNNSNSKIFYWKKDLDKWLKSRKKFYPSRNKNKEKKV